MSDDAPYRPRRALAPVDDAETDREHTDADDTTADDPSTDAEQPGAPETRSPWSRPSAEAGPQADAGTDAERHPEPQTEADPETDEHSPASGPQGADRSTDPTQPAGSRTRRWGRVGAVAALMVVVLAIGYAAFAFSGNGQVAVVLGQDPPVSGPPPTPTPTPPVSEDRLLNVEQAKFLAPKSDWQVARTQTGRDAESPVATCLHRPGTDDTPADSTFLRTLTASGEREMAILHEANTYADRDQAVHVFGEIARELGGCAVEGSYLHGAETIDALGNQALAVRVSVAPGGNAAQQEYHTVLVIRTGRVLNVVDAATTDKFVTGQILAETMIPVVNVQCTDAVGLCAQEPKTDAVVPPIGGEHPGLPVVADVPRLPKMTGRWAATDPVRDPQLPVGTSCERLDQPKSKPTATIARAYLVQDDEAIPQTYGWDLVLFTLKDDKQAGSFLDDVSASINDCEDRQRTAEVSKATTFDGTGTKNTKLQGVTWQVRQQTGADADTDYVDFRVALVRAGNKVVYLFLPLEKGVNFSDGQWQALALRAGERATQIT